MLSLNLSSSDRRIASRHFSKMAVGGLYETRLRRNDQLRVELTFCNTVMM
jgi:hypothetical protein